MLRCISADVSIVCEEEQLAQSTLRPTAHFVIGPNQEASQLDISKIGAHHVGRKGWCPFCFLDLMDRTSR